MNQAVNPNPNFLQTGLLLALVAAIAGAGSYGLYRYAGAIEELSVDAEASSGEKSTVTGDVSESSRSKEVAISIPSGSDREPLVQPIGTPAAPTIDLKSPPPSPGQKNHR